MSMFDFGILIDVMEIVLVLILALIVVVLGAWLIEKVSEGVRSKYPGLLPDFRRLREIDSFDHKWVLRKLLSKYPQRFSYSDIVEVVAHCYPREKDVWGEDSHSFFWFWIVELTISFRKDPLFRYAFVAGYFDPNQYDTMTEFKAWLFRSLEEAEECARKEMQSHTVFKLCPGQKLYEYLVAQI